MAENRELALILKLVADNFNSELKKSQGLLGGFNSFIKDWKTQLVAAGGALFAIAKSTANYGDELVKTSQKMGVSIEDTARLRHAANLAGTDLQTLTKTVGVLSRNMFEASAFGMTEAKRALATVGLSATNTNGTLKSTTQVLIELSDKFRLMPEGPEKTARAMLALGKSGKEVLPFLNSDLRAAFEEADRLGLVMSDKNARAAEHFNDELTKLQGAIRGVTNDIGTLLIPKFDAIAHALTTIITDARAAAIALGSIPDQPNIQFFKDKEGRLSKRLPPPPGVDEAIVQPFFETEEQARKRTEQLTVRRQLEEQAVQGRLALLQEGFARASVILETGVSAGMTMEVEAATARALLRHQELAAERDSLVARKTQEVQFYAERQTLTFKDDDERLKIKTEHLKKLGDLDQKIALNAARATTASIQGQQEVDKANATRIRTQNELLFEGAASLKADREEQQQFMIDNAQAWVAYYDQLGGNAQDFYKRRQDLLAAQLAKELDITKAQSDDLLQAFVERDSLRSEAILAASPKGLTGAQKETIELNATRQAIINLRETSDDFFSGWAEGMRQYVADTQSGFGLAADMSRRTAQAMEQSFRNFFFDVMDNKIRSLKDVFVSLLGFVKQIIATITAQLVTSNILDVLSGFGGSYALSTHGPVPKVGAATGGTVVKRFALGGPVPGFGTRDTVPALLTPGEVVLSRTDVQDIKRGAAGGSPVSIAITVNAMGGERRESAGSAPPNFSQLARDLSRLVEVKIIEEQRPGGLLAGA